MDKNQEAKITPEMTEEEIFAVHHVNEDRLLAMKEYKNARFQGMTIALFIMSAILLGICVYLYGIAQNVTLFCLAGIGVQGALLEDGRPKIGAYEKLCHFLYLLPFPAMLLNFVAYEMESPYYEYILTWSVVGGAAILFLGMIPHFLRNPYRCMRRDIRHANSDVRRMEKLRAKQQRRQEKQARREELKLEREAEKEAKRKEREAASAARSEMIAEKKEQLSENMKNGFAVIRSKISDMMPGKNEASDTEGELGTEAGTDTNSELVATPKVVSDTEPDITSSNTKTDTAQEQKLTS